MNWLELDDGIESQGETTSYKDSLFAPGETAFYYRIRQE
jgi:hypothetical protein